jgi:hypothetical protein
MPLPNQAFDPSEAAVTWKYPREAGHRGVEAEVRRALADPADFRGVPQEAPDHGRKTSGIVRDTSNESRPAFWVRDGHHVSARWPGDIHEFARHSVAVLDELTPA